MSDIELVQPRSLGCQIQGFLNIACLHGGTQLPSQDVARVIIQNRGQIEPAPADGFEVSKVGLLQLVRRRRRVDEPDRRLHQDLGRTNDQVMSLQKTVDRGFR